MVSGAYDPYPPENAEVLPLIDLVAEVRDARIPESSRNPDLAELVGGKPRICLLNKKDTADEAATARWLEAIQQQGIPALAVDWQNRSGFCWLFASGASNACPADRAVEAKGHGRHPIHILVAGIPNSGKSSFINRLSRGARPGWRTVPVLPEQSVVYGGGRDSAVGHTRCPLAQIRRSGGGAAFGLYRRYTGSGAGW